MEEGKPKHQRIKNKNYRQFLDTGVISTLNEDKIVLALENVQGKYKIEGRAFLINCYYTGGRPSELLKQKGKDFEKKGNYLAVTISGGKGGLTRTILLSLNKTLVKELYKYIRTVFPDMFAFFHYRSKSKRLFMRKKGIVEFENLTNRLHYHFSVWFKDVVEDGLTPYFLRHNRFSKMMEAGLSTEEVRIMKGARSISSVTPYLHLSSTTQKKIARKID